MKYVIYKLAEPEHLMTTDIISYERRSIQRQVLEPISDYRIEDTNPTIEDAVAEIHKHKELLNYANLTIIPVIRVSWDGEVY